MPELPEVEVTRRSFADQIAEAAILAVHPGKPLRWPLGCAPAALVASRVLGVRRRGKYLLLDLVLPAESARAGKTRTAESAKMSAPLPSSLPARLLGAAAPTPAPAPAAAAPGARTGLLLVHLGMSGSLSFARALPPAGPHDHFDLVTSHGTLRLHDPRRFGAVVWAPSERAGMAAKLLGDLGPEPLADDFDAAAFARALKRHHMAIKPLLLGGKVVAGVGNIYACEALFRAGVDPRVAADRVGGPRALRLARAIRAVLAEALARGGTTLRDFRDAHGAHGWFQLDARVYGRAGLACPVCGTPIRMIRQGQRSTFFCPHCQKR